MVIICSQCGAPLDTFKAVNNKVICEYCGSTNNLNLADNTKKEPVLCLIETGYLQLENQEWSLATSFFNEGLKSNPQRAEIYLGLLLASRKLIAMEYLELEDRVLSDSTNYRKALSFAKPELKTELERINAAIAARLEHVNRPIEKIYEEKQWQQTNTGYGISWNQVLPFTV